MEDSAIVVLLTEAAPLLGAITVDQIEDHPFWSVGFDDGLVLLIDHLADQGKVVIFSPVSGVAITESLLEDLLVVNADASYIENVSYGLDGDGEEILQILEMSAGALSIEALKRALSLFRSNLHHLRSHYSGDETTTKHAEDGAGGLPFGAMPV